MPKFTKIHMSALRQADWTKKGKELLGNPQKLLESNDALYKKELENCQQKSKKDLSDFRAPVKKAELAVSVSEVRSGFRSHLIRPGPAGGAPAGAAPGAAGAALAGG